MFKNTIRKRRLELGLSQTKLACKIGVASTVMSNIELGKLKPWPKIKSDLAKVLETSEEELFPNE